MTGRRWQEGGILLALFGAACSGCKTEREKWRENYERRVAAATVEVESFRGQLRAIRSDLDASPPREETPCDAERVGRAFGAAKGGLGPLFADTVFVDAVLARQDTPISERDDAWFVQVPLFFSAPMLVRDPVRFSEGLDSARRYSGNAMVVFVTMEDVRPTMNGGDPATWSEPIIPAGAFSAGKLDAWAVVFDSGRADRLCQVHVRATSSESVAYVSGRPSAALLQDYAARARVAGAEALARSDSRLRLHY